MKSEKVLALLGFAQKAGMLQSGTANVEAMLEQGKAEIILIAEDVSANVHRKWSMAAKAHKLPIYIFEKKETLGHAVGRSPRSVVCVTNERMAAAIDESFKS